MDLISTGDPVRFTSPDDGRSYVGTVENVGKTGIAKVRYQHVYGSELIEQSEFVRLTRLVRA